MDTIELLQFYRKPALTGVQEQQLSQSIANLTGLKSVDLQTEYCFYVQTAKVLTHKELEILSWLLSETFEPGNLLPFQIQNREKFY